MYCVHNGEVCVMVYDTLFHKYRYISEDDWYKMEKSRKRRYKRDRDSVLTLDKEEI